MHSFVFKIRPLVTLQHKNGCHIPNMSHTAIMLNGHIDPTFCTYLPEHTKCNSYFTHSCQICTRNKCAPEMPHLPITPGAHETNMSVYYTSYELTVKIVSVYYTSYELTVISHVTKSTDVNKFHIIGICPWNNMPPTSHMNVPLH